MRKLFCVAVILLGGIVGLRAQEAFDHTFEVGFGGTSFNPSFIFNPVELVRSPGLTLYAEYRFGITDWLAVGAQLDFKISRGDAIKQIAMSIFNQLRYYQESIKLLAEVKFCPDRTVKPFIAVNLGPGFGQFRLLTTDPLNTLLYCDLGARAGVQFGDHLRGAFQFSVTPGVKDGKLSIVDSNFSSIGVTLGWAF